MLDQLMFCFVFLTGLRSCQRAHACMLHVFSWGFSCLHHHWPPPPHLQNHPPCPIICSSTHHLLHWDFLPTSMSLKTQYFPLCPKNIFWDCWKWKRATEVEGEVREQRAESRNQGRWKWFLEPSSYEPVFVRWWFRKGTEFKWAQLKHQRLWFEPVIVC